MISLPSGIILVVAFAVAFAISRFVLKRRATRAAEQAQRRQAEIMRNMPPPTPSRNKSKRRREARMKR